MKLTLHRPTPREVVIVHGAPWEGNTWLKLMWNQDEEKPLMAAGVDGRQPHKFSPLSARWSELSQWDRKVYNLALKEFLSQSQEQRAASAPVMLLSTKRACVSF